MRSTTTRFIRQSFRIASSEAPWLSLHLRAVMPSEGSPRAVLLLHGATLASYVFDLPVPGYSLQERLAGAGWASYALDARGFGQSSRPAPGAPGCPADRPIGSAAEGVGDVSDVIRFLRHQRRHTEVVLIGFSWGTILAGRFLAAHPDAVNKVILCAPIYGAPNSRWLAGFEAPGSPAHSGFGFGAYRWTTADKLRARWDSEIPAMEKTAWRASDVLAEVLEGALRSDPLSPTRTPAAFRSPSGCSIDLLRAFSGHEPFEAASIRVPILLVRGDSDTTSTRDDVQRLLERLKSRNRHSVTIASGSHFLCFERSAPLLFDACVTFL